MDWWKRVRSYLRVALIGAFCGVAGFAFAIPAGISLFSGPQDPSQLFNYLNQLINSANGEVNSWIFFASGVETAGELNFTNAGSFAVNGQVATAMSSLGPTGSHTTIQEWLVIVDNNGFIRFAPLF